MLAHLGPMLAYLGPMFAHLGALRSKNTIQWQFALVSNVLQAVSPLLLFPEPLVSGDGAQGKLKNGHGHETAKNWSSGGFNMRKIIAQV